MMEILRSLILLYSLSYVAWTDWRAKRIPNEILIFMLATGSVLLFVESLLCGRNWMVVAVAMSGFAAGGGVFFLFYLITGRGIGAGDVKLSAVVGFYLGSHRIMLVSVFAFFLAGCVCIFLLLRKRTGFRQEIPFAPFMLSGTVMVMILGI